MKTKAIKTIGILSVAIILVLSGTVVSWKSSDSQVMQSTGNKGSHRLAQSSILVADNDKDNRGQTKKRNRLQEDDCFSDDSCLHDRKQARNRIQLLERQTTETENRFQFYLRANLTDAEKSFVNTQLDAFRSDVDTLDDDLKDALRSGSDLQPIRNRISSLYATYTGALSPYIDPSKTEEFRLALQTILTNHINLRQLSENRRVLSDQDESKIERFITWVPPSQRLDYLLRVLSRVEKLMGNIENSNMNPVRKERFLALLDDILMLVQARITDITSGWSDTIPPVILSTSVIWISINSATLRVMVNESGRGYYVILGSGATAPTAAQVKAGQDALGQTVALRGSGTITSGTNQFVLTGLSINTSYAIYFTAEDASNNLQPTVQKTSFTTLASVDVTPPTITSLIIDTIVMTGARLSVTSNEVGTGYYVILASGSIAPTSAQVKAGQNSASQSVSLAGSGMIVNGTVVFTLSNLTANTAYTLYFTAQDTSGNTLVPPMSASFITLAIPDVTPPVISALSVTGTTSTGTNLLATVNESGTGYYVVLLSGSVAPSAVQVQLGQTSTGLTVPMYGSGVTIIGINQFPIIGLTASGSYNIYFTAKDAVGNLQPIVQTVPVTTLSQ